MRFEIKISLNHELEMKVSGYWLNEVPPFALALIEKFGAVAIVGFRNKVGAPCKPQK